MTVAKLLENPAFTLVSEGDLNREIECVYCCDLLSIVMGRAPAECAWVTVMGNINSVAVAVLADMSVVILAEGNAGDEIMIERAKQQNVNVLKTDLPIYEAAVIVGGGINNA